MPQDIREYLAHRNNDTFSVKDQSSVPPLETSPSPLSPPPTLGQPLWSLCWSSMQQARSCFEPLFLLMISARDALPSGKHVVGPPFIQISAQCHPQRGLPESPFQNVDPLSLSLALFIFIVVLILNRHPLFLPRTPSGPYFPPPGQPLQVFATWRGRLCPSQAPCDTDSCISHGKMRE